MSNKYVYIDIAKEWDMELKINKDSSFVLEDNYGCNKLSQKGTWFCLPSNDSIFKYGMIVLVDTLTQVKEYNDLFEKKYYIYTSGNNGKEYKSIGDDTYFKLVKFDTVRILNGNKTKLLFKGASFYRNNNNIKGLRVQKQENELIRKLGVETYINVYGDGISKKIARKKLEKCGS